MAPLHILVVEDHPSSNRVLTDLLRRRGHVVTPVLTAEAALDAASQLRFDLAIIDIGLSDDDGWHLLQELRCRIPGLAAIAMTGYGFESDRRKSDEAGFSGHLIKPLCMAALEKEITLLFPSAVARPLSDPG